MLTIADETTWSCERRAVSNHRTRTSRESAYHVLGILGRLDLLLAVVQPRKEARRSARSASARGKAEAHLETQQAWTSPER